MKFQVGDIVCGDEKYNFTGIDSKCEVIETDCSNQNGDLYVKILDCPDKHGIGKCYYIKSSRTTLISRDEDGNLDYEFQVGDIVHGDNSYNFTNEYSRCEVIKTNCENWRGDLRVKILDCWDSSNVGMTCYMKSSRATLISKYEDKHDKTKNETNKEEELEEMAGNKKEVKAKKEKGGNSMLNVKEMLKKMFGEIGRVKDGSVAMTFTGAIAVKRSDGDYVRYNSDKKVIENQGSFVIPKSDKMIILFPTQRVEVGDIIKNKGKYLQVLEVEDTKLSCVNIEGGRKTTVIKETNMFNMNFYTKVVGIMGNIATGGNGILNNPLLLLLMDDKQSEEGEFGMKELLMLSTMFGGQNGGQAQINPMMLMMMGDMGEDSDMFTTMMMVQAMSGSQGGFGDMFNFGGQAVQEKKVDASDIIAEKDKRIDELSAMVSAMSEQLKKISEGKTKEDK